MVAAFATALVAATAATAAPRMYLGFLDDKSLRWDRDRAAAWDHARAANATVARTIVHWDQVARRRPAHPRDSRDRAYNFADVDEFMRNAQRRGVEVLVTLYGTPAWANDGRAANVPPTNPRDFRAFARAVADRYSGRHPRYPFVRFYSVWNEPNSPRFFRARHRAAAYADLAAAAIAGIRAGSPSALVALGETASRHAPAAFMEGVARARPDLRFDAWAHHPYPQTAAGAPDERAAWPNVGLHELDRFGAELDAAFGRSEIPVWVTEYAESAPAVSPARQAHDLARAVALAARVPRVSMFVWFMLRNHRGEPWQSGVLHHESYRAFRAAAQLLDARNALVAVDPSAPTHVIEVPALELRWQVPTGVRVRVRYALSECGATVASGSPGSEMRADGWVPLRLSFAVSDDSRYRLDVVVRDGHGVWVHRKLDIVPRDAAGDTAGCGEFRSP